MNRIVSVNQIPALGLRRFALHRKQSGEEGSILVLLAISLVVLLGMVGLAMDVGQMFVAKQQVQAAADAAALAGIMDMYNGTYSTGAYGTATTCSAGTSGWTPCYYARKNGLSTDTTRVDFPAFRPASGDACTTGGGGGSIICVTVQRTITTTLMRVLSSASPVVAATAAAEITAGPALLPIVVLHPSISSAISSGGTQSGIQICGGPSRAIQVNSDSPTAVSSGLSADLSKAGPGSNGLCTDTTLFGADFRSWGGPATKPAGITLGPNGNYVQPASKIFDPLAAVPEFAPSGILAAPANAPVDTALLANMSGCPAAPPQPCRLYSPGAYPAGIDVFKQTAVFKPGVYYVSGSKGFVGDSNGTVLMATGFTDGTAGSAICSVAPCATTNTGWTGNMLIYNTGTGSFNVKSNFCSDIPCSLVGSPLNSTFQAILFFQDRKSSADAGSSFGGGGTVSVTGTLYLTSNKNGSYPGVFQTLSFSGGSGGTTTVFGEIIADRISLGGSSKIRMALIPTASPNVRQVALVQ
ncbi:MAG: hypothetical protein JWN34_3739 [Bryobacterales bacterium]|nr:hypothetical protein [Bryobacterales bacterium]